MTESCTISRSFLSSSKKIIEHNGTVVPDEVLRTGHRYQKMNKKGFCKNPIRSKQRIGINKTKPVHPDCLDALQSLVTIDPTWRTSEETEEAPIVHDVEHLDEDSDSDESYEPSDSGDDSTSDSDFDSDSESITSNHHKSGEANDSETYH